MICLLPSISDFCKSFFFSFSLLQKPPSFPWKQCKFSWINVQGWYKIGLYRLNVVSQMVVVPSSCSLLQVHQQYYCYSLQSKWPTTAQRWVLTGFRSVPTCWLTLGQLQTWTERSTLIFENLKPKISTNHFNILWTPSKVELIFKIRRVKLKNCVTFWFLYWCQIFISVVFRL